MVAALHARSVESPLPLLVAATVAKASPCLWPLPRAARGPTGSGAGSTLVPGRSPAAFSAVRPLGCLIRLNVSPWVKKMVGCVFFPLDMKQQLGLEPPAMTGFTSWSRWVTSVAEVNQTRVRRELIY